MKWFTARLLFETKQMSGAPSLFEERFYLLQSESESEAGEKADTLGRAEELTYANMEGNTVKVTYLRMLDLGEVISERVSDGTEIYSHTLTKQEVLEIEASLKPFRDDQI